MKRTDIELHTEELLLPILDANRFSLVDVEYVKEGSTWYLRAYIDKEGGITIDDCEIVSRALEEKLDQAILIPDAYVLEVSSPGLGRPLKKEKDFVRNQGKEIDLKLYRAFEHEKELRGVLKSWDAHAVTIETADGRTLTFEKKELALIFEAVDW